MSENSDLSDSLWNQDIVKDYKSPEKCRDHILEQYKVYTEMADRISARRATTNTFFLTLNTLIVGTISACVERISLLSAVIICIAAVVLCYVWKHLLRSYRQLNTAKYAVIGEMEKRLPCSPYWLAEWKALGEGKDPGKYTQLTVVEKRVPIVFMVLYIALALVITEQYWLWLLKKLWVFLTSWC